MNEYLPVIISEGFIILIITISLLILFNLKPYTLFGDKNYVSKKFISILIFIILILLLIPPLIYETNIIKDIKDDNMKFKCFKKMFYVFILLIISFIIILFIKNKFVTNPKPYNDDGSVYYSDVNTIKNDNYHYHFKIKKNNLKEINDISIIKSDSPDASDKYDFKIEITRYNTIRLNVKTDYGANKLSEYKNQERDFTSEDILINKNEDLVFDIIILKNRVYFIVNDKIEEIKILDYRVKDRYNTLFYNLSDVTDNFSPENIQIKLKYKIRYNLLNIENFKNVGIFTNTKKCINIDDYDSDKNNTISLLDNCPNEDVTSYYGTVKSCINENKDINFIGCDKTNNKCYQINDDVYNNKFKDSGLKIKNSCKSGDLKIYKNNYEQTNMVENQDFNIRLKGVNKKLLKPKFAGKLNSNNYSDIENCLSKCKTDVWEPNEDINNKKFSIIPRSNSTYCFCEDGSSRTKYKNRSYTFQVMNKV